jgi:hypothetical protein
MRLPRLSEAVVRRTPSPSCRPRGAIRLQGMVRGPTPTPTPVKQCGDACAGIDDTSCPGICPCTQVSPGVFQCKE